MADELVHIVEGHVGIFCAVIVDRITALDKNISVQLSTEQQTAKGKPIAFTLSCVL